MNSGEETENVITSARGFGLLCYLISYLNNLIAIIKLSVDSKQYIIAHAVHN